MHVIFDESIFPFANVTPSALPVASHVQSVLPIVSPPISLLVIISTFIPSDSHVSSFARDDELSSSSSPFSLSFLIILLCLFHKFNHLVLNLLMSPLVMLLLILFLLH